MSVVLINPYRYTAAAGGFTPTDIAGLQAWYDASDASTFTYSSGVVVSQWNDKSGNARHLTQSDTNAQPSRNGTQNGLDTVAVSTAGTFDYMDTASFTVAQPLTAFVACDYTIGALLSSVGGNLQLGYGTVAAFKFYAGTSEITITGGSGAQVLAFVINGASSQAWRNGTSIGTGNPGSSGTTTGLRLAERNLVVGSAFSGEHFEIIVYNSALSTTDRQSVESYLKTKWGTP